MKIREPKRTLKVEILSAAILAAFIGLACLNVLASDWPTYRHGPGRAAASDEQLAKELHLQWEREYPKLIPSWLGEYPHLRFDANYEPIVVGKTLFFSSSDDDSVTALDADTGELRWRFYTNGPVRLAPAAWKGKIYFGADDGALYCLDAGKGTLIWKFDTALSDRKGFIEGRLTTICPIRGGPVIDKGQVHFVAGIWSWENSAFFTLDAETGKQIRVQKGIRAQGYLSAIGPWFFLANGRAGATRLTRDGGAWAGGLGGWAGYWDHLIEGSGDWIVRMGSLQKFGKAPNGLVCEPGPGKSAICFYRPVIADGVIYYCAAKKVAPRVDKPGPEIGDIVACSLKEPMMVKAIDAKGKPILTRQGEPETKLLLKELWRLPKAKIVEALGTRGSGLVNLEIKAGKRLYGYHGATVFAVDLPTKDSPPTVSWKTNVEGAPARIVAANGKLFVVTAEGRLYCFGEKKVTPKIYSKEERELAELKDEWTQKASTILKETGIEDGYCLVLGLRSGRLVEELFRQSRLHIIAIDKNQDLVRALREKFSYLKDASQTAEKRQTANDGTPLIMAGSAEISPKRRRIVIYEDDPTSYASPPYLASLIVSEDPQEIAKQPSRAKSLFDALRPYGGTICLELLASEHDVLAKAVVKSRLPKAKLRRKDGFTFLSRVGALEGSANWTDEWADAANTLKSDDDLKTPLGMLWTGGLSARRDIYFDRHRVPPAPPVIDGRMFIAGPERLVAIDIYTGRILWDVRSKLFTAMTRGAGGCHTVGASDGIYVSTRKSILRFDPATGRLLSELILPPDLAKGGIWGRARIWRDTLITAVVRSGHDKILMALNRYSGEPLWSIEAESSFSFVAMGNDKIFCWDGSARDLGALKAARRGGPAPRIPGRSLKAFDSRSGRELWRTKTDSVVDWLSYSEEMAVLVASTRKRIHAYSGSDGHELWHRYSEGIGFAGHPGRVWQKVILWHDWIIDQRGPGLAYDLLTGKRIERPHPVTLKPAPWEFIRQGHHCNHAIASENLLTFRSSNASYVDLTTLGSGTFPGFRTGCTNSLVVAGGILNSPMYAHLCSCGYEFFTSLAFANMPNVESWTYRPNKLDFLRRPGLGRARRLGINFNAPGERRAPNGTLWFGLGSRYGYGLSGLSVNISGTKPFRFPLTEVQGDGPNWVFATGIEGLKAFTAPLAGDKNVKEESHTVRLYFMEPSAMKPGERVFSVRLQNQDVLKDFDIAKAAGGPMRGVVKEFQGIKAGASLTIAFTATKSQPVVCGVEVINEAAGTIPPEVHNSFVQAPVGETAAVKLFYTDADGPGPYTFKVARPPAKGSLSGGGPVFTYTPKAGVFGRDAFTWVVNDGEKDSREAVVTIKLLAPNVTPEAQDLKLNATAGTSASVTLPFNDPDELPGRYRFEVVKKPAGGTVEWQSYNRFLYTPRADFAGADSFRWKVNDGQADSNVAAVTLNVKPDAESPTVSYIDSAGPNDRIKVVFSEPVDRSDAEKVASYAVDNGVEIQGAALSEDGRSVTLTTSKLKEDAAYSLTINNVRDRATKPNSIKPGTRIAFNYVYVGNGLWGEYYEGRDFKGKKIGERIDHIIDVNWRQKPPLPSIKLGTPYSVRWTGRLKADYTEEYMIDFIKGWEHNRNPVRIWVDGKLLLNDSSGGAAVESSAFGRVSLQAGKTYDLKVELNITRPEYSRYADTYILRWSSLSTPKQTIPQSNLGTVRRVSGAPATEK